MAGSFVSKTIQYPVPALQLASHRSEEKTTANYYQPLHKKTGKKEVKLLYKKKEDVLLSGIPRGEEEEFGVGGGN